MQQLALTWAFSRCMQCRSCAGGQQIDEPADGMQVSFEIADCTTAEFQPESYDVIYSRDTLLHIYEKPALFKRCLPGAPLLAKSTPATLLHRITVQHPCPVCTFPDPYVRQPQVHGDAAAGRPAADQRLLPQSRRRLQGL